MKTTNLKPGYVYEQVQVGIYAVRRFRAALRLDGRRVEWVGDTLHTFPSGALAEAKRELESRQ